MKDDFKEQEVVQVTFKKADKIQETVPRRVAIFSDAHALLEPTLALLEDAHKKGITEIYSLGDNIGTGPNPREVLELLEEYHVQSILGNHELYVVEGIHPFEKHLSETGSIEEAVRNRNFTRGQLSDHQIHNIQLFPTSIELLMGEEKILLCHTHLDYNTNYPVIDTNGYAMVLKGHTHFEEIDHNIRTLRSSSFGKREIPKKAYYLILTEREKSGFQMDVCKVSYDYDKLIRNVEESSLEEQDKIKLKRWV